MAVSEKNQLSKNNASGRDAKVVAAHKVLPVHTELLLPWRLVGSRESLAQLFPFQEREGEKDHFSNRDLKFSSQVL